MSRCFTGLAEYVIISVHVLLYILMHALIFSMERIQSFEQPKE